MKNKGITLIALVITIIVLLIITGITISELVSNDSIIVKTQKAKEENLKNQIFEEMKLKIYEIQTEKRGNARRLRFRKIHHSQSDLQILRTAERRHLHWRAVH